MDIRLHLASTEPPEGHAADADGSDRSDFYGWLGLIRVLADLVGARERATSEPPAGGV